MMEYTPKIGAFVLETLTTGMYPNPLDSIREYIQNAFDSVEDAQSIKQLKPNEGTIHVTLDTSTSTLKIRDNGTGITADEVHSRLLNIGMSHKAYGKQAGFRGIGRLAGIAYCKRLIFKTTSMYEDEMSIIIFNCDGIRKSISPESKKYEELTNVIKNNTDQDLHECNKKEHFFEVCLEGIKETASMFLDSNALESYLSQVAPVEYDAQRFIFATKVEKWAKDHGIFIPHTKVLICDKDSGSERQVFKPYKTNYKTKIKKYDLEVKDIGFYPEKVDSDSGFWLWYSKTDLLGMFDDEMVSGLRFRRNNIAIGGPERVSELFKGNEGRLNNWMMGEIHILSDRVIPNARRDGFEDTPAWKKTITSLGPFIESHIKSCRDLSKSRNLPTVKLLASAKKVIDAAKDAHKTGFTSPDERDNLNNKINRELTKIEKVLECNTKGKEEVKKLKSTQTSLKALQENILSEDNFTVKKLKTSLDKKQKKVIREILEIVNKVMSDVNCTKQTKCLEALKKAIITKYQMTNNG